MREELEKESDGTAEVNLFCVVNMVLWYALDDEKVENVFLGWFWEREGLTPRTKSKSEREKGLRSRSMIWV